MIEAPANVGHEADFAMWEAELSNLGGLAVTTQIERPVPQLPDLTPAEADAFAANLAAWNTDTMFTDEDRAFLESAGITARAMTDEELRETARRERAAEIALQAHQAGHAAYGAQEQANIRWGLRRLETANTTTDEDDDELPAAA